MSEYYEKVVSEFEEWLNVERERNNIPKKEEQKIFKLVANYLISDLKGLMGSKEFVEERFKITPENFAEFIKMIYLEQISSKAAKMVLLDMFDTGADPSDIVKENNLGQISDSGEIDMVINEVISKNPKAVEDYKKGKEASLQFLAGQVMAATRGRVKPDIVQNSLKKALSEAK